MCCSFELDGSYSAEIFHAFMSFVLVVVLPWLGDDWTRPNRGLFSFKLVYDIMECVFDGQRIAYVQISPSFCVPI